MKTTMEILRDRLLSLPDESKALVAVYHELLSWETSGQGEFANLAQELRQAGQEVLARRAAGSDLMDLMAGFQPAAAEYIT